MKSLTPTFFVASLLLLSAIVSARADTYYYDNAGRLTSASQSNGMNQVYSCDQEADIDSISVSGTDSAHVGMPDWWQDYYFGGTGVSGTASAANDGISNLAKYALGLNPLVSASNQLLSEQYLTYTDGKVYPYLTYDCAIAAAASVILESSSNGGTTWQSGTGYFQQVSVQDLGNGAEQITQRCLTPLPQAYGLLFRVQINGDTGSSAVVYLNLSSTPQWWAGVTNGNARSDFSAANQGQLKNIATAAVNQLNVALSVTGSAGAILNGLFVTWSATSSQTSDYATVNLGALKTVVKPFYDRLLAVGYTGVPLISGTYPWVGGSESDFATANIGEVKNAFSFNPNFTTNPVNPLNLW